MSKCESGHIATHDSLVELRRKLSEVPPGADWMSCTEHDRHDLRMALDVLISRLLQSATASPKLAKVLAEARSSEAYRQESASLDAAIKAACEAYEKLSPVDKALHDSDQRRSYVEGETGRDPGDVLADEVRRLRALPSANVSRIERAYCAANDYINALTQPGISAESLEKIKRDYFRAVLAVTPEIACAGCSGAYEGCPTPEECLAARKSHSTDSTVTQEKP